MSTYSEGLHEENYKITAPLRLRGSSKNWNEHDEQILNIKDKETEYFKVHADIKI